MTHSMPCQVKLEVRQVLYLWVRLVCMGVLTLYQVHLLLWGGSCLIKVALHMGLQGYRRLHSPCQWWGLQLVKELLAFWPGQVRVHIHPINLYPPLTNINQCICQDLELCPLTAGLWRTICNIAGIILEIFATQKRTFHFFIVVVVGLMCCSCGRFFRTYPFSLVIMNCELQDYFHGCSP